MRRFKNLPKNKQLELNSQFSKLRLLYECRESKAYKHLCVSVFDHWLSRDEAIKEIDNVTILDQRKRDHKLHDFCVKLAENYESYLVKPKGRTKSRYTFREFTSSNALTNVLQPLPYNVGDKWRFTLVLPSIGVVYFEASDFTHYIYYKDYALLSSLEKLIKVNELHILK